MMSAPTDFCADSYLDATTRGKVRPRADDRNAKALEYCIDSSTVGRLENRSGHHLYVFRSEHIHAPSARLTGRDHDTLVGSV
jgi:hypothetical protein